MHIALRQRLLVVDVVRRKPLSSTRFRLFTHAPDTKPATALLRLVTHTPDVQRQRLFLAETQGLQQCTTLTLISQRKYISRSSEKSGPFSRSPGMLGILGL